MSKESKIDTEKLDDQPQDMPEVNEAENTEQSTEESSAIIEITEAEHQKLIAEAADYKDKYVRLFAEFDNARKRMDREKLEFVKYANEELIIEFLGILDDLERAVQASQDKKEDHAEFVKGIEMVMSNIHTMLKKNGVKSMEAKGQLFDHNCHEILMQEEIEDGEDNIILEEFQKGYYLGEKVVRTAKVKVAKLKK